MKKINFSISIISTLACLFMPLVSLAFGQMTEPIIITNALRGNEYQEMLTVINTEDNSANISFSTEGEIKSWTKFYLPNDLQNPIESVTIGASQNKNIVTIFIVPADMPNGKYIGLVSAIKKPEAISAEEGSSASVAQKIDREVSIIVGGEEEIGLQVSVIPKSYDIKKGDSLDIRFIFDNLGNVSLRPQIDLKIKNLDGQVVYNVIYPYPESELSVRPNAQYEIPAITVPTNGLENGKYFVEVDFLHNKSVIFEKDFRFNVGTVIDTGQFLAAIAKIGGGNIIAAWFIIGIFFIILAIILSALYKRPKFIKVGISKFRSLF